jgi:hypothetical protein
MRHSLSLKVWLVVLGLVPTPSVAQDDRCPGSITTDDWLKAGIELGPFQEIPSERVIPVDGNIAEAVKKLRKKPAISLKNSEVARFVGESSVLPNQPNLRPYLVRSVFATTNTVVKVRWYGEQLSVFAGSLGCPYYTKHPIIVFLERRPREVFVGAATAL